MKIMVKRIYDKPTKTDGMRVLVDRLWPRGVTKEAAHIDLWLKEVTPSNELRSWFHADTQNRYNVFAKKYRAELAALPASTFTPLMQTKSLTLVTAVKDIEHSHIPTLTTFLQDML